MRPTLHQLKIFRTVAQQKNFTRASALLHMSQPAVSMQVKQLESTTGMPLLEQIGKKLYLTEAGEVIYQCALEIKQQIETAQESLDQLQGLKRGRLKISVATTAGYFIIKLLAQFSEEYPQISVNLDVTNRDSLIQQLTHNERDLIVMGEPPENHNLSSTPILDNPLIMVAHNKHELIQSKNIQLKELENETFVTREKGSGTRAAIERFFKEKSIQIHSSIEMTSNEAIKQAVQAGMGLGIVSKHTVQLELETGYLKELSVEGLPILRRWYIVQNLHKRHSLVSETFKQFVLKNYINFNTEMP